MVGAEDVDDALREPAPDRLAMLGARTGGFICSFVPRRA